VLSKEESMRGRSVLVAMILAIALYFTLFWGYDALRILTSPTYGLEDVWRSQVVFGIGSWIGLSPYGLLKLAAAYGAMKLVVAGVCAVHILDRFRSLIGGTPDSAVLEGGLLVVVAISLAAVGPALWSSNGELVREHLIHLLLAGLAAALCIIERNRSQAIVLSAAEPADDAEPITPGRWLAKPIMKADHAGQAH
jgi:hypothetical protein